MKNILGSDERLPLFVRLLANLSALMVIALLLFPGVGMAAASPLMKECLLKEMEIGGDKMTLGGLKALCQSKLDDGGIAHVAKEPNGVVDDRLDMDTANLKNPYTLMAHRANYIMVAHNGKGFGEEVFQEQYSNPTIDLDDTEVQFQVSLKFPLAVDLFDKNIDIYAAYTNRSFWQLFNDDISSPFRDTNHEPEAWVQIRPDWEVLGFKNAVNQFGFVHQSNGQGGVLSRSWNRLFANFIFEKNSLAVRLKPWIRIEEDKEDDDNPDIEDYLGYGEISAAYKWEGHTFDVMVRNLFESSFEKGTVQLSWSFPLGNYEHFRGYVQYFNGYGQSLIDYDRNVNSLGVGISLTDVL